MLYKEENPQEDPNKSYLHNQTFLDWLKKQYWLLISQVAVLAYILYFIASFAYYVTQGEYHEFLEPRTIQKAIYYTHIPILLLFIFGLIWIIKVNKKNYQKAREAYKRVFNKELDLIHAEHSENQLKRFKTWFLVFWIGMCALYITFTFQINLQERHESIGKREIFKMIESLNIKDVNSKGKNGDTKIKLEEKIIELEVLIENIADARTNLWEYKIFSKIKAIRDNDLKKRIEETIKLIPISENSTAQIKEIYDRVREAFNTTDIEVRRGYIKEIQEKIDKLLNNDLSSTEKDIFTNIKNIKTDKLNYPENLENSVENIIESIKKQETIDTVTKSEQIDEKVKNAYITKDISKIKDANELIYKKNYYSETRNKIIFTFITYLFNNFGSWTIFVCFIISSTLASDEESIKKEKRKFHTSIFILITLVIAFPLVIIPLFYNGITESSLTSLIVFFDGLSGIVNAVTLALLIARLDSKLIGLPSYLISILYFYAAFQPLFVVFEQPGEISQIIKTIVLIVVFIAKIYFFLIITFALQTGRMLTYLYCYPTLSRRVDSIFANQFLIISEEKAHDFKFSIKKGTEEIYSGEYITDDAEAFFRKIDELKEVIKNEDHIHLTPTSIDTYKIEIYGKNNEEVICESIVSNMSKDIAERWKIESKHNIPYCEVRHINKGKQIQILTGENIEKSYQESKSIEKESGRTSKKPPQKNKK